MYLIKKDHQAKSIIIHLSYSCIITMIIRWISRMFLILYIILQVLCQNTTLSGPISASATYVSFNYTFTLSYPSTVNLGFRISNQPYSNVLMVFNTTPFTSTNLTPAMLSSLYLQQSQQLSYMDVQSTIEGSYQLVSMRLSNLTNVLYFILYNFDLPTVQTNKNYQLNIIFTSVNKLQCKPCPYGSTFNPNANYCSCQPCSPNYFGPACENLQQPMQQNFLYYTNINSQGNFYFRIINPPPTIILYFNQSHSTNSVTLYMQYEIVIGGLAGYLNTNYDNNSLPFSKLVTTFSSIVKINTQNKNLSLTLSCSQYVTTMVTLSYGGSSQSLNLGLVLGLGVMLPVLAVLVVAIVCLCKKRRQRMKNLTMNEYFLSNQEINIYFPEVDANLILNLGQNFMNQSYQKLKIEKQQTQRKISNQYECVICLNDIIAAQKIRVLYCRHFFHSVCLMSWFRKNQNCPFCRNECSREPTLQAYQNLRRGHKKLVGQRLAQAILRVQKEQEVEVQLEKKRDNCSMQAEMGDLKQNMEVNDDFIKIGQLKEENNIKERIQQEPNRQIFLSSVGELQSM